MGNGMDGNGRDERCFSGLPGNHSAVGGLEEKTGAGQVLTKCLLAIAIPPTRSAVSQARRAKRTIDKRDQLG